MNDMIFLRISPVNFVEAIQFLHSRRFNQIPLPQNCFVQFYCYTLRHSLHSNQTIMVPIAKVLRQIGADTQSLAINLSNQPKSVLENIPSLTPPPGIVSNFQHRAFRRESIIVVSTLLMALGLICICIRA